LLSLGSVVFGQATRSNFVFNKVLPPDGILFIHITGITQDKSGYLWFSSKKGFYRYDGYQMTTYQNDPLDPNSVPTNALEAICADNNGNIWLASLGAGLIKFDPVHSKFTQYRHSATDPSSLSADWTSVVMADKSGNIWVGSGEGLDRLDPQTGKFTRYRHDRNNPNSLSANPVFSLYEDRKGTIWVGTGTIYGPDKNDPLVGGLNRLDNISGKFTRFLHDPADSTSLINNKVRSIFESSDGTFWIGTAGDGLHTMDRSTGRFRRYRYDPANPAKLSRPALNTGAPQMITFITEDKKGGIWIGTTDNGLSHYDPKSRRVTRFSMQAQSESEFGQADAWCAHSSADGIVWIGTFMGALQKVNTTQVTMPLVNLNVGEINGFCEDDDGNFWMASGHAGVFQFDKNKRLLNRYVHDPNNPKSLINDSLFTINKDSYGNIWLGTISHGVDQFIKRTGEFVHHSHDEKNAGSLSNNSIIYNYEDRNKNSWFGTMRGLNLLNRENNSFRGYLFYPQDTSFFGKNIVTSIIQDGGLRYWVSSYAGGGLHLLDQTTGRFKTYLAGISIARLFEDHSKRVWAGGIEGLFYYDEGVDNFVRFVDPVGLTPIADVRSIIEDADNTLWVGTTLTMIRISPKRDVVTKYDNHIGINIAMSYGQAYRDKSGQLYFAADDGYYTLNPRLFDKDAAAPKILISRFRLSNQDVFPGEKSVLEAPIADTREITLNYDQNVFSFDFAAIDFIDPQANRHLFKLDNYDEAWNVAGFERRALYFNVPPGKYVFRVRAVNAYGKWSERTIDITIVPAWWSRWWFRILVIVATVAVIYLLIKWRLQEKYRLQMERADREKELSLLQQRTSQLEMHALRAQMNPHFLFNSLNSINRFILQNNSDQASAYLTKFSRLMRLILQNSQNELVPLENEVDALRLYLDLEAVRFDHQFSYKIDIDPNLDVSALRVPPLIIQPYAENAIWHGLMHKEEKGHLLIELVDGGTFLICRITDDGIGRQKAAELKSKSASTHKSMGMKITADRITSMKTARSNDNQIQITDLVHADGSPAGTSVEIKISLQYD
jgi:ligand-binding sensor domain-containing protein